jgi:hypothetical protein
MAGDELRDLVQSSLEGCEAVFEARVPPRRNNVLIALRRH